jgi:hypothetical protein
MMDLVRREALLNALMSQLNECIVGVALDPIRARKAIRAMLPILAPAKGIDLGQGACMEVCDQDGRVLTIESLTPDGETLRIGVRT